MACERVTSLCRVCFVAGVLYVLPAGYLPHCYAGEDGLKWEVREREIRAEPFQKEIRATFPFANVGKKIVLIERVRTDCGCTAATPTQREIGPGESGEIELIFEVGERRGEQVRRLSVTTDNDRRPVHLFLRTAVPQVVGLEPGLVRWNRDEDGVVRTVEIGVLPELEVAELHAKSDVDWMEVSVAEREENNQWQLEVALPLDRPGGRDGSK